MTATHLVRVTSVRSRGLSGMGGCIFSAKVIDSSGNVADSGRSLVVKASGAVLRGDLVQPGQWWRVSGAESSRQLQLDGYLLTETQIDAESASIERPSGEHLVTFLADSPAFPGIGQVKARRLWEHFGARLYEVLDSGDSTALQEVLSEEQADSLVQGWQLQGDSKTLQWLQTEGMDVALGKKVLRFFGQETSAKLAEDPYRLLSFCAGWREVDTLARKHFHVAIDDPRRLQGAIEEACYRTFAAGHTACLSSRLMDEVSAVLGGGHRSPGWRELVHKSLSSGLTNGSYVVSHHGVQPLGAYVMERQVARAVACRISSSAPVVPDDALAAVLARYETRENLSLNAEQQEAVRSAMRNRVLLVTGGAGVGKTTVLKAMYEAFDAAGVAVVQLALAGRAAKRMQEATGRKATTIANYLGTARESLPAETVVVVDEASMVDIVSMSRLCESIGDAARLVLVGDPSQLMPVGPGLVLHALVEVPEVPKVHLLAVKRYGGLIASAANDIRAGRWPTLPDDASAPIALLATDDRGSDIASMVLALYQQQPAGTQVLCAVRNGSDGTKFLNATCQEVLTSRAPAVKVWSDRHGAYISTGLHLGDPVLCTRNLWDRGLQNGSLGVVTKVEEEPLALLSDEGELQAYALAWVEWDDGVVRPIVEAMLDDIELGYAITIHKAQGSQWQRVIVPLTGRRLLDRTLIYTAVTRAQSQVILIGPPEAIRAAVEAEPRARSRSVNLDLHLGRLLLTDR